MSSSQFDDLLGDLGESSTKTATIGDLGDFDPFGPSGGSTTTTNGAGSDLLLDFSNDNTQVKNGEVSVTQGHSTNPLYDAFDSDPAPQPATNTSDSTNPLYDEFFTDPAPTTTTTELAEHNQSADLLGDFSEEPQQPAAGANPLYEEFSGDASTNPLYEEQISDAPANPLYEEQFPGEYQMTEPSQEELQQEPEQDPAMDFTGSSEPQQQQQQDEFDEDEKILVEAMEPQVMNGDPRHWVGQNLEQEEYQEEQEYLEDQKPEPAAAVEEDCPDQDHPDIPIVEVTASPGTGGGRDEVEAYEEREEEEAVRALAAEEGGAAVSDTIGDDDIELEQPQQPLPDLVVREPGDPEDDGVGELEEELALEDVGGAGMGAELESPESDSTHLQEDTAQQHYGQDRREEDLEQYCMDREDSDIPIEVPVTAHAQESPEPQQEQIEHETVPPSVYRSSSTIVLSPSQVSRDHFTWSVDSRSRDSVEDAFKPGTDTREEILVSDSRQEVQTENTPSSWEDSRDKEDVLRETAEKVIEPRSPPARTESSSSQSGTMASRDARIGLEDGEDEEEEGVYENEPQRRDDVIREADRDVTQDLPAVGTASSMKARFLQDVQTATSTPSPQARREITPPAHGTGGEYVSEPRAVVEQYEAKIDAGVFESPEPTRNPEVVSSYEVAEEVQPEQGLAKNLAARFKDLESQNSSPSAPRPGQRREITPPGGDAQTEYVSEPRGPGVEHYDVKVDAGVFESEPQVNPDVVHSGELAEEMLPERGTARNMASRYLQMTEESKSPPSASSKPLKEIVLASDTRVEFESEPQKNPDVVTSDTQVEEFLPEKGFAKNLASRFKELESTAKSPPLSPGRHKEFTPPRETEQVAVRESQPAESNPEVVHSGDLVEETLPEKGTARNMMQRFKQLEAENKSPPGPTKAKKEFTPPPGEAGVYENTPKTFQADYNRPAESGIVENDPLQRSDVSRGDEPPKYEEELPERGAAKNLVSKWRQLESESAKAKSPGSRPKEFTPPRDEPRLATRKSPRTPMSPGGEGGSNGSVHPSELPGQYQPQQGESVFESQPEQQQEDVLREGERDYAQDLPKKNTAKKMLARFQSFQEKANQGSADQGAARQSREPERRKFGRKESPRVNSKIEPQSPRVNSRIEAESPRINSRIEPQSPRVTSRIEPEPEPEEPAMESARQMFEDPTQIGRSKSMKAAILVEKCGACGKTVYAMERLEMNKTVYHKNCFRCSVCRTVLTAKTFAINNGVIYCTTHYKQLFTTKGNYDEGFGRMQHKKRWNSNPNLAEGENGDNNTTTTQNGHHQQHAVAAANS